VGLGGVVGVFGRSSGGGGVSSGGGGGREMGGGVGSGLATWDEGWVGVLGVAGVGGWNVGAAGEVG
jgi:hypothetical protein